MGKKVLRGKDLVVLPGSHTLWKASNFMLSWSLLESPNLETVYVCSAWFGIQDFVTLC